MRLCYLLKGYQLKNLLLLLSALISLSACSGKVSMNVRQDQGLAPYAELFVRYGIEQKGIDYTDVVSGVSMIFGTPSDDESVLGVCKVYNVTRPLSGSYVAGRTIVISRDFWADASEEEKEILTMHELGHCALGRTHNNNNVIAPINGRDTKINSSLMSEFIISAFQYMIAKEFYISELFNEGSAYAMVFGESSSQAQRMLTSVEHTEANDCGGHEDLHLTEVELLNQELGSN